MHLANRYSGWNSFPVRLIFRFLKVQWWSHIFYVCGRTKFRWFHPLFPCLQSFRKKFNRWGEKRQPLCPRRCLSFHISYARLIMVARCSRTNTQPRHRKEPRFQGLCQWEHRSGKRIRSHCHLRRWCRKGLWTFREIRRSIQEKANRWEDEKYCFHTRSGWVGCPLRQVLTHAYSMKSIQVLDRDRSSYFALVRFSEPCK